MSDIEEYKTRFEKRLSDTVTLTDIDSLTLDYLGRNGIINTLLQQIKDISPEEKRTYGQSINTFKLHVSSEIEKKRQIILTEEESSEQVDITLPGLIYPQGSLHLITYAIEEISAIFAKIGFIRMSYPEVEWEHFSFDSLNMPPDHPARDDFETFFIDTAAHPEYGKMVLTPHTSSGQPREMMRLGKPPIRMINIAKTYRPNWDASHTPMFHQFEGLCVDRGINITHLKGTIDYFAKQFFGESRETRLRPFHFQFTEPSFEVDITCDICKGTGVITRDGNQEKCKLCKSGWLELGGSGMVHPNVLKAGGIDPDEYTGWAFGFGVERVFMMKEGLNIDDIRVLYNGDVRFLEQF
jgi:phenylalanyl-tRNA synthetase alpha chain